MKWTAGHRGCPLYLGPAAPVGKSGQGGARPERSLDCILSVGENCRNLWVWVVKFGISYTHCQVWVKSSFFWSLDRFQFAEEFGRRLHPVLNSSEE